MSKYLDTKVIDSYLSKIDNISKEIHDMKNEINKSEKIINILKELLIKNCDHIKMVDVTSYDERTQYFCSKCQQYL
jgi:hypothetical protein